MEALVRPLDREAHCLRRWDAAAEPGFLLLQPRPAALVPRLRQHDGVRIEGTDSSDGGIVRLSTGSGEDQARYSHSDQGMRWTMLGELMAVGCSQAQADEAIREAPGTTETCVGVEELLADD